MVLFCSVEWLQTSYCLYACLYHLIFYKLHLMAFAGAKDDSAM